MAKYTPPRQSKVGQIIDVVILLVLIIVALRVPLLLGLAGSALTPQPAIENATWQQLGQDTPEKVAGWTALGFTDPTDKALQTMITNRYDYWSFSNLELAVMVIVVVGYFFIVIRYSDKEYREVIEEKFGSGK